MRTRIPGRPARTLVGILLLILGGLAAAEPPTRAARLGYAGGTVSFSPAGQPDWLQATVNRPLTTGDRLWAGTDSRAEMQIGGTSIRLGPRTSMTVLNLDDRIAQVQLSQGTLKLRVRWIAPNQSIEIATPNLALILRRPGDYRIEVDPGDDATAVVVRSGEAEVYGDSGAYSVDPRRGYRFYGTDLSDYDVLRARGDDELDRWALERDRRGESSLSARYVSTEVVGYEELDASGVWRVDPDYGPVWTPNRVAAGWTPYRDGHWAWIDPWGWTWVDDAPWGYAVSHYGRWANLNGSWGWVPGPPRERAVYAPALVAFVGGRNLQISVSVGGTGAPAVGWFPLAPREVYRPSYAVSRDYFDSINRSNAVIAPTTITNVYNTTNVTNVTNVVNVVYANQQVAGAVVAVPAQTFAQSLPVAKAAVALSRDAAVGAGVAHVAPVAPVAQSVQGGARDAVTRPPVREQAVVARTAPPPPPVPFAVQQQQLAAKPGIPIDEGQRAQLKPAPVAAAAKVNVVAAAPAPTAAALPPASAPAARTPEERKAAVVKAEAASGVVRKPEDDRAAAARAETAKAEEVRAAARTASAGAEASRATASKAAADKAAVDKAAVDKAVADKAVADKAAVNKVAADQAAADKAAADKAAADRAAAERVAADKAAAAKAATAKADASKVEAVQAEAARVEASKVEAAKSDAARTDAAKAEAARAATSRAEAARADAGKADAARGETARAAAAKADSARADAAKAEASRVDAAKAEAARSEAARNEALKADTAKADAARAAAAKADAARAETTRADAARAEATKADAARTAAVRAEAARADAARAEAARSAQPKAPPADLSRAQPPAPKSSDPRGTPKDDEKKASDDGRKR